MTGFMKPCTHPGCHELTSSGRCEAHKRHLMDWREPPRKRGYDHDWWKVRQRHITREPICRSCMQQGRTTSGELVDHIIPLRQGGARLDHANLQTLCRSCHARKTAAENRP